MIIGGFIYEIIPPFKNWYGESFQFRPFDHIGWKLGLPLFHLIYGLIVGLLYGILYKGIPGPNTVAKGAIFGFLLWLLVGVALTLIRWSITITPFPLPCLLNSLCTLVAGCILIAVIFGTSLQEE
jgi:xanthosine utilization system XapX-like protein